MIGAGNVATHLAHALQKADCRIEAVFSRRLENAQTLASSLPYAIATDDIDALPDADVYFLCVKDDAIPGLVARLAKQRSGCKSLVVHTAGSVPLSAVGNCFENAAVLYPMQTFSRAREVDFSKIPLFVEATNGQSLSHIMHLATLLSHKVTQLDSERRQSLHLAAVFACNFANHCYALAAGILQDAGIDPKNLLPLIDETASKVHHLSPVEAQTGPAVRWDENVLQHHAKLLENKKDVALIYQTMSESIHNLHTHK